MTNLAPIVREIVEPLYRTVAWAHGWPHIQSVVKSTHQLAEKTGADSDLCEVAAYCHDLGRVAEMQGPEVGSTGHAEDSVSRTIEVLRKAGASNTLAGIVVGAVSVHSDRTYSGRNLVAQVLRDCDKKDSLGPWGTLRCSRHHFGRDLADTIPDNPGDAVLIDSLATKTAAIVKGNPQFLGTYLNNLNFVLEWVDNNMLDTPQAYEFLREGYEYSRIERLELVSDVLSELSFSSRKTERQRAAHSFHDASYTGLQFWVNLIQPESYILPHARSSPERINCLTGSLCDLQFDNTGKLKRKILLNKESPFMELPANTFHTMISLELDSSIGVTIKGPFQASYRTNAPWAPLEQESHKTFFDNLKSLV